MLAEELEQDADQLILHHAQPFGAAPAMALLEQLLLGGSARGAERRLEPHRDRTA